MNRGMGKHSQKILYRKYLFSIKEKERDKGYGQSLSYKRPSNINELLH